MQQYQPQTSSIEDIFPNYQLNQEAMNELKSLLKLSKGLRENSTRSKLQEKINEKEINLKKYK